MLTQVVTGTYTGATLVAGPGAALIAGKGVATHYRRVSTEESRVLQELRRTAAWTSARDLPAGRVGAGSWTFAGTGMTSEQSVSSAGFWPRVASLAMAASNFVTIESWSTTAAQGGQVRRAVRLSLEDGTYG